jgi:hypothetical protein
MANLRVLRLEPRAHGCTPSTRGRREDRRRSAWYVQGVNDTCGSARARYYELLRSQKPHERLAQAMALTAMVRQLACAGIRRRHPDADENEVRVRLTVRLYGRDVAARLFGDVPEDAR